MLARWSGWGAAQEVFDDERADWMAEREALRDLLDEDGWAEARRTTINAHYTDPGVVQAMWEAAQRLGFDGGRVLEPGCGAGSFMAYAPEDVEMVGVERDRTSAAVAQALYPQANIHAQRFEKFDAYTPFDMTIGNVPFASAVPHDGRYNRARHSLHNYFLLKGLRLTRPGGLVLALTSLYTMDSKNPAARREIAEYGDLVGALRLPRGSMRRIAGTDAVMDILILRRREPDAAPRGAEWTLTTEIDAISEQDGTTQQVTINQYFATLRQQVLGEITAGNGMYGSDELTVRGDLDDIGGQVARGLALILTSTDLRLTPPATAAAGSQVTPGHKVGDVELAGDRKPELRRKSFVQSRTGILYQHEFGELVTADVPRNAVPEVQALIRLRDHTVNLLALEAADAHDDEIEGTRTQLAGEYESYVRRWGPLNRVSWQRTGRTDPQTGEDKRRRVPARLGGFRQDPEWPTLAAVEIYDEDTGIATPATIQRQRVIHPPARRLGADTPDEAIAISLDETGQVDLDRIAALLGTDRDTARSDIAPLVYENPATGELVTAEDYLSGDVRSKLTTAREAADRDERFIRNVDALEAVHPTQIGPGDIVVKPGVPWVPTRDVEAFAGEALGILNPKVSFERATGRWTASGSAGAGSSWGTQQRSVAQSRMARRAGRLTFDPEGRWTFSTWVTPEAFLAGRRGRVDQLRLSLDPLVG